MNLQNLVVETKTAVVEFPGLEGFEVTIGYISREMDRKIVKESTVTKIDTKMKQPVSTLDEDMFVTGLVRAAIKNWKGLTYDHLAELMLFDTAAVEDMAAEVPFSIENAITLIKQSQTFDSWVNEQIRNIASFR